MAATAALGALWDMLNSRSKQELGDYANLDLIFGSPVEIVSTGEVWTDSKEQIRCGTNLIGSTPIHYKNGDKGGSVYGVVRVVVSAYESYYRRVCGAAANLTLDLGVRCFRQDGSAVWAWRFGAQKGDQGPTDRFHREDSRVYIQKVVIRANGIDVPLPVMPRFPYIPGPLPELEPEPLTAPEVLPPPRPAPPVAPPLAVPGPPPVTTPPGSDPVAPPAFRPITFPGPTPVPLPLRPPTTTPLPPPTQLPNQDGSMSPLPPTTGPQTPPGTELFLDEVIGQPGQAPPPTLQGIASEVGRIEQKLRVLSKQPSGGSADLGPLLEQLAEILDRLTGEYPGGSYQLVGPCEPALGGGPGASRSAAWGSGTGSFASIIARVDALAELMQHHKDLRQPICRQKASGEEVTVVFEEIG